MTRCLICKGETYPLEDPEINVTHHVCKTCGYTFKDRAHLVDEAKEKALYSNHQNTMDNEGYVNMFERFLDFAVDREESFGPALDFGSGPGPVLYELLKRRGFESHHYDPYFNDDDTVFSRAYGVITSTEVFEHLSDPVGTFEKLAGQLRPGGRLALMTMLRPRNDTEFLKWWYRRDQTHIGFFTTKAMEMMAAHGDLDFTKTNDKNHFLFTRKRRQA